MATNWQKFTKLKFYGMIDDKVYCIRISCAQVFVCGGAGI